MVHVLKSVNTLIFFLYRSYTRVTNDHSHSSVSTVDHHHCLEQRECYVAVQYHWEGRGQREKMVHSHDDQPDDV